MNVNKGDTHVPIMLQLSLKLAEINFDFYCGIQLIYYHSVTSIFL